MAEPSAGVEAGASWETHDHLAFHWLVIEDIDLHDAVVPDKAGLSLETDDSSVIFGGVHAAQRVLEGVHAFSCALYGSHAPANCTEDAEATSA
jgi:hypothetical protein